jgi:glycosyltransferase involved in cell wall biosynthesis
MIDGMNLALEQGTGVATYARNLASCVRRLGHDLTILYGKPGPRRGDPVLREAVFLDDVREPRSASRLLWQFVRALGPVWPVEVPQTGLVLRTQRHLQFPESRRYLNYPGLFQTAMDRFVMTGRLLEVRLPEPVDIAHWTYPIPIRARGIKNIYTLHDVVPLKLPYATLDRKMRYWRVLKAIVDSADHIITVSEQSRRDIVGMLPSSADKVTNTYQSVILPEHVLDVSATDVATELAHAFHGPDGERAHLQPREFFLFVGAIEPKKNIRRLLEAYLAAGVEQPLLVVGRRGWRYEDDVKMMQRSPRIIYLDYLPLGQMITLMRSARALVWPSLYEGFGLPIIESFLCGTPVITARGSATEEVAGDAALLVDPYDPRDIRDAIRRLSDRDSEALRAELVARGHRRARAFSEAAIAPHIQQIYETVRGR